MRRLARRDMALDPEHAIEDLMSGGTPQAVTKLSAHHPPLTKVAR